MVDWSQAARAAFLVELHRATYTHLEAVERTRLEFLAITGGVSAALFAAIGYLRAAGHATPLAAVFAIAVVFAMTVVGILACVRANANVGDCQANITRFASETGFPDYDLAAAFGANRLRHLTGRRLYLAAHVVLSLAVLVGLAGVIAGWL